MKRGDRHHAAVHVAAYRSRAARDVVLEVEAEQVIEECQREPAHGADGDGSEDGLAQFAQRAGEEPDEHVDDQQRQRQGDDLRFGGVQVVDDELQEVGHGELGRVDGREAPERQHEPAFELEEERQHHLDGRPVLFGQKLLLAKQQPRETRRSLLDHPVGAPLPGLSGLPPVAAAGHWQIRPVAGTATRDSRVRSRGTRRQGRRPGRDGPKSATAASSPS